MNTLNLTPAISVVLGGGGAVGIAWQVGLITGLREHGIDLSSAKNILGTSAGAIVGALLAADRDVTEALASFAILADSMPPEDLRRGNDAFLNLVHGSDLGGQDISAVLRTIGAAAQDTAAIPETKYLGLFDFLGDGPWPNAFSCTAINTDTGALTIWDAGDGVDLRTAIAASCSVPMLFPTVTAENRPFTDGGLASHLNAAAAPEGDIVIALSCHPLTTAAGVVLNPSEERSVAELEELSQDRTVVAVEADYGNIGASPATMMDPAVARLAIGAGREQAAAVAKRIRPLLARWQNEI